MYKIVSDARVTARKINFFLTKTPSAAAGVIEEIAFRIRDRMNVRQPVQYPINWDSEKQRRAFFATNGFGHGIPYVRTGEAVWTVTKPFEDEVNLFAPHPAGPVFGRMPDGGFWQSNIHRGTWPALLPVLMQEIARIPAAIREKLKILINE
jgi:hypothetical protein